ncbi:MAG: fatty acid desaturase, partial [Flavobacteriales bacterium]|nr:fatty acid desaturase [Flavobacteriales bacterium]
HPAREIAILLIFKAIYYTLNFVLPFVLLSAPWWVVLMGVLSINILSGYTFALIFQANHIFEGTHFPIPDDEGNIENNYAIHTLETTMDFARNNPIACWLMGCINVHVIHHMFPKHCHVHSRKLTEILIETCNEYGIRYNELPTFRDAAQYHYAMIKKLSKPDTKVPAYEEQNILALQRVNALNN